MDYAKEYDRMVEQSNRQQKEIELLQAMLRDVSEGLDIIERKLTEADAADPADAPFPLVGEQANLWHRATASAYLHAVEMCNSDSVRRFVANGFKHDETTGPVKPKPAMKTYVVIGRIPFDDEDSCYAFAAKSREEAVEMFDDALYQDSGLDEGCRTRNIQAHGCSVFINHVLVSDGPIETL